MSRGCAEVLDRSERRLVCYGDEDGDESCSPAEPWESGDTRMREAALVAGVLWSLARGEQSRMGGRALGNAMRQVQVRVHEAGELAPKWQGVCAVAETPVEWEHGLQGRVYLAPGEGMLFVFPNSVRKRAMWMVGMLVRLDVLWLDDQKRVIWRQQQLMNDGRGDVYYSPEASRYLLEVPAGTCGAHDLGWGDVVSWEDDAGADE